MTSTLGGSIELQILFCAMALGLIQLVLAFLLTLPKVGVLYEVGPRDEPKPLGTIGGRADRAFKNFLETFVFFAAAVLLNTVLGKHTAMSALGAQIYIWARLIYVPLYILGIPWLRTLVWIASFVGILMVMAAFWPGM
ncbi:MAG: MAPEG family protein [Alphaproteobacteria bacterium]|nr:MAPEG family protein [Alphaproteobacteria bacterium]MDE2109777.1 MAPEG family protein [Alphaproteobacteria bacterium]MDE2495664.1 MAPEG family protein [Alphaproteobacteria bacterium]